MKKIIFLFVFSCFLLFPFFPTQAIVQKTGNNVYLNSNEIVEDDLIVAGQTIEINGLIKGDLFVFGQTIAINGNVEGDIIGFGRQITINGNVNGNVRIFGENVKFNNQVDKNVNIFGQNIFFTEKSKIEKNLLIFGDNVEMNGKIDGSIYGKGEKISLAGEINKNAKLNATSLVLLPKTIIKGDLDYIAPKEAEIQSGAQISGKTFYKLPSFEKKETKYSAAFFFWKLVSLFGFLIVGVIFISLFRKGTLEIVDQIKKTPWKSFLWGMVYFIIIPIASLLSIAMLIGIPLGLIGICLYFVFLYLAQLFVGITIGIEIDKKIRKPKEVVLLASLNNTEGNLTGSVSEQEEKINLIWPMILGMIILIILFSLSFLGGFFKLIVIWFGLGGIIESVKCKMKNEN